MSPTYDFVVNEKDMGLNVEGRNGIEYVEKASFSLELLKHVDAGQQSGWHIRLQSALVDSQIVMYGCLVKTFSSMEMAPYKPRNLLFHVGETGFQYGRKWQKKRAYSWSHPWYKATIIWPCASWCCEGTDKTVHDNTMAAILTIGMSIIFVFYSFSIHHTRPLNYFVNNTHS